MESIGYRDEVVFHNHAHRSVSGGLIDVVKEFDATALVLGSSASRPARPGGDRVHRGSAAAFLTGAGGHRSPLLSRIAERPHQQSYLRLPRHPESVEVVRRVASLAERLGVPMRVITFAVRGRTMYPPEVGLHAEDSILAAWESQAGEMLAGCAPTGLSVRTSRCRWSW